ncbi:Lsr2 family DNA-binding protein [Microlunatus kandeliicorticis]
MHEWAEANGIEVSSRGRISAAVREQYEAAN